MSASAAPDQDIPLLDKLPNDLMLIIISKLASQASCPADYIGLLLTCKRMNNLGLDASVLSIISPRALVCSVTNWGEDKPPEFLNRCVRAGNVEAMYSLGVMSYYLYEERGLGVFHIAKAAFNRHPHALYAMSVIHFNGSIIDVNFKRGRRLQLAFNYALRAAFLGNVDALLELGHRMKDGDDVRRDPDEGRRFLLQANARQVLSIMPPTAASRTKPEDGILLPLPKTPVRGLVGSWLRWVPRGPRLPGPVSESDLPAETDFGWDLPAPVPHPANRCVREYYDFFDIGGSSLFELRKCSCEGCCRFETRDNEFFQCRCLERCYCSRACQAKDWKWSHGPDCFNIETDDDDDDNDNEENVALDGIQEVDDGDLQVE